MVAIKLTREMNLIQDIDTPAIVVDLNIVKENINTYQKYCDDIGIKSVSYTHLTLPTICSV